MPSPDSLKIRCFTPIPSEPEVDLDGKMLTKDATTKDCLFTMTEYLSENVLQSIPKEFRIKQFFNKGLFKSLRKQNPFNNTEKPEAAKEPVKEGKTKNPEVAKKGDTKKPEAAKKGDTKKPEVAKEGETKKPEGIKEGETKKPEVAKEGETKKPEVAKEGETTPLDIKVGGKEGSSTEEENIANKRELISTYRKIINHNIRLTLNTLFQKNNKIVIKGNTYTIGYYNWTDYDWDIDAKRPTFDKKQYVTSQSVKQQLEKIPSILKHGLITSSDELSAENDFFSVTAFDNEEEAVKAKESEAAAKAKESEAAIKAKESEATIKAKEEEAAIKAKEEEAAKAKENEAIQAKEKLQKERIELDKNLKLDKTQFNKIDKSEDVSGSSQVRELGEIDTSDILPGVKFRREAAALARSPTALDTTPPSMKSTEPLQETEPMKPESESGSGTVNEVPNTQTGGGTSENHSNTQEDSFRDSRRSSDPRYRSSDPRYRSSDPRYHSSDLRYRSSDPRYRSSSFDRRFPYDSRYDPRYRSHSKMVNADESNFAIYISVEIYLVKGETLSPEDESNLKCQNNWNNVLEKFDKLTGREKRGILPDYTLEPTSKHESSKKPSGSSSSTSKEPVPTSKDSTTKEPNAHGGRIRVGRKTLRQKKRKTIKKKKHHKRRGFRTTRKRKLRGSRRK